MLWNYQLDIFRLNVGLEAFDKARDNNFVVRDEGAAGNELQLGQRKTLVVGIESP